MDYDIIIIGAGPGGYETAVEAANRGLKVAVVERDLPGGTCLNRGCIPTKALCHCAEVLSTVNSAAEWGISGCENATADYGVAARHKDTVVEQLRQGVRSLLATPGIELIEGEASFTDSGDPHAVAVGDKLITAKHVIIATGSAPKALPIPGAELAISSDEALQLTSLPESMCIIGGGVIGMEFAGIFAAYGVQVTVVEFCKEILPPFDKDVAKRLRTAMQKRGVKFQLQAAVTAIEDGKSGERIVRYDLKGKSCEIAADTVLMAVGRRAVLPKGLESVGVETVRGAIVVNDRMRTTVPEIYAIGDVNARCMLAHVATAQGSIALNDIMDCEPDCDLDIVPSAVFTHPELAMVGLTEEQCKAQGLDVTVKKGFFRSNGKALAMGQTDGIVKMIVDNDDSQIVGCHICGPHASDLIQEVVTLMANYDTVHGLADAIHGHPTLSEAVLSVARQFD